MYKKHFGVQLTLSTFKENSLEAYRQMIDNNKVNPQQQAILSLLKLGKSNAAVLSNIPQYNARIYELRRMGYCIQNIKIDGGRWFVLNTTPHDFGLFNGSECLNCGTPNRRRQ